METVLLNVVSDIYSFIDQDQDVILMLFDLSAAFDTLDCDVLVGHLASRLGFKGVIVQWLNSYLRSHKTCHHYGCNVRIPRVSFGPSAICFVCPPLD